MHSFGATQCICAQINTNNSLDARSWLPLNGPPADSGQCKYPSPRFIVPHFAAPFPTSCQNLMILSGELMVIGGWLAGMVYCMLHHWANNVFLADSSLKPPRSRQVVIVFSTSNTKLVYLRRPCASCWIMAGPSGSPASHKAPIP